MRRTPYPSRTELLRDLHDLSLSVFDIRKKYRISERTVYNVASEYNINMRERSKTRTLIHKKQMLEREIQASTIRAFPNV